MFCSPRHEGYEEDALANATHRQVLGFNASRYTDLGKGDYAHLTWANDPPSDFQKLTDTIDMGYAAPSTTIAHVMSTTGGEFCYFYL
jgi:tyrosinase